jgi:transposase
VSTQNRLFFFDEGRFGLKPSVGRTWARRGSVTPRVVVEPGYDNFYLYSAVAPTTGDQFTLFLPNVDTEMMSLYLQELGKAYPGDSIWLILDGAGWHNSASLKTPSNIKLISLPPYSPELNPVERLWRWLRMNVCRNKHFKKIEEVEEALLLAIRGLSTDFLKSLCGCSYLQSFN